MSPERRVYRFDYYSFPRVSGDEPLTVAVECGRLGFSPRERG